MGTDRQPVCPEPRNEKTGMRPCVMCRLSSGVLNSRGADGRPFRDRGTRDPFAPPGAWMVAVLAGSSGRLPAGQRPWAALLATSVRLPQGNARGTLRVGGGGPRQSRVVGL